MRSAALPAPLVLHQRQLQPTLLLHQQLVQLPIESRPESQVVYRYQSLRITISGSIWLSRCLIQDPLAGRDRRLCSCCDLLVRGHAEAGSGVSCARSGRDCLSAAGSRTEQEAKHLSSGNDGCRRADISENGGRRRSVIRSPGVSSHSSGQGNRPFLERPAGDAGPRNETA